MEIAVHLNATIDTSIRADNLRGEWRWERQVLDALLADERVSKVYSLFPVWRSPLPMPAKFMDGLPAAKTKETVCLFHDSWDLAMQYEFKGLLIQVFGGPGPAQIPILTKLVEAYGKKFLFTYGSAHLLDCKQTSLESTVPLGHVEHLTIPGVPKVYNTNNFDKSIILFPNRDLLGLMRVGKDRLKELYDLEALFVWVAAKLKEDQSKQFHILSGSCQADLDFMHCADMVAEFFSHEIAQCLLPFREQIVIHRGIGWDGMLDMFSQTKVVVGTLGDAGGTPKEAAAFGIPTIGGSPDGRGLFSFCPQYLSARPFSPAYIDIIERLYTDREFYLRVGSAYRDFVDRFYSYKAFTNSLFDIFQKRGMLCGSTIS